MKKIYKLIVPAVILSAVSATASAAEETTKSVQLKDRTAIMEKKLHARQDYMLKMHDYSTRILAEKDPEKRIN